MSHIPTLDELVDRAAQPSPQAEKENTRLTPAPDSATFVNQLDRSNLRDGESALAADKLQAPAEPEFAAMSIGVQAASADAPASSAGYRETQIGVNRIQVLAPQETPDEIRQHLANLGVNLAEIPLGRKHVFDDFMQGRLVSILAMGLSIRQAAAALGVSHVAVWKVLKRDPAIMEQVNAARFQAQIEPLLVVLRESKRNWRAATWLMNYLSKSVTKHEETPDEAKLRRQEETDEFFRDGDARYLQRKKDREAAERQAARNSAAHRKQQRQQKQPKRVPTDTARSLAAELAALAGVKLPKAGTAE